MNKAGLVKSIKKISSKAAQELGYELVDVEIEDGSKHLLISIFIYSSKGINFDDCTLMSRKIEDDVDKLDIEKSYYLEVSSPGLDRPLKTQDDYRRNLNNEVEVKLFAPLNDKKSYIGKLIEYDKENIVLCDDDQNIEIPIKYISLMKQTIKF
ncbi:MAG: ribosome maturation factor RimP [Peptoniphilus sp.]|nr:ribosome maturation factor RimP [Peptoniphilus sp.]